MSPKYEFDRMTKMYGEVEKVTAKLTLKRNSVWYLLIPMIALFFAGIFYRRKNPEISIHSFLTSAIGIGLIYSLLVSIIISISAVLIII